MLKQKQLDYESENCAPFPDFMTLSVAESTIIRRRLFERIGIDASLERQEIGKLFSMSFREIDKSIPIENGPFLYDRVVGYCGYDPVVVFVNFYEFDSLDLISLRNLSCILNDIWHPGAEDMDIFDWTFSWVVQVNHGEVLQAFRAES
ncbi:hypothetical protein A1351_02745 [Methylosinus sp. R-45379]|uniref:hypothetical protein n=1 Tax=unclassified Methylosinus TaxID=2624500 RepID=UPI0004672F48|nr:MULTISPECIES: hypothetical protein [unclassified Methylosinus]OAI24917.1 hypothetical protein A1351_02745 [Methylosinus sp. R-45379]